MQPSLTTAVPGKLNLTVAQFYNSGQDDIISVKLLNSATTGNFFTGSNTAGMAWTEVNLPLIGDFGVALADLSRAHLLALSDQERTTNLTIDFLFNWLTLIWPNVRTAFIASTNRQLPYTMSFLCPSDPPPGLAVELPNSTSVVTPSSVTSLQIHVPATIPFSSLVVDDQTTQATASINYPMNEMQVLGGSPIVFIANPGTQTLMSHSFKWYIPGFSVMSGLQISLTLPAYTVNTNIPVTLLVTNLKTGISKSSTIYIVTVP